MFSLRRRARELLSNSTLKNFNDIVCAAKIADDDLEILDLKFVHGFSNVQIAQHCNCSLEKVNYIIKRSYDKIARLL